ncbi:MAG: class F sortase [Chloroflexi bacterium]|nr:class F sortase [Chloroflexota bacterium]
MALVFSLMLVAATGCSLFGAAPAASPPRAPTTTPTLEPLGVAAITPLASPTPLPTATAAATSTVAPSRTATPTPSSNGGNVGLDATGPPVSAPPQKAPPAPSPSSGLIFSPQSTSYRLSIPQINVDASVLGVGLMADGTMADPPGPDDIAWFSPGTKPGDRGNALFNGHLDWRDRVTGIARTAIFWRLKELDAGSQIILYDGQKRYTYVVTKSLKFRYDDPQALSVMLPSEEAIITLITCEGPGFDPVARNYTYRRVVIARLASTS